MGKVNNRAGILTSGNEPVATSTLSLNFLSVLLEIVSQISKSLQRALDTRHEARTVRGDGS